MLALAGRTVVFTGVSASDRHKPLIAAGASIETVPLRAGRLDLSAVLQQLGELEINELLVEAGPTLSGAILEAGLVDELVIYLAPMVLGADASDAFVLPPLTDLIDAPRFRFVDTTEIGGDIRITARPDPA
jgi:diaminohydroxyphosphoribosylaminopyrimidine deaminase/5-amino-6-(5-phosphoribosylamino)uracil reductase